MSRIEFIKKAHTKKQNLIKIRLAEFEDISKTGDDKIIFRELCFCILTANASAKMGIRSIDKISPVLMSASAEELAALLKGTHRFYNTRAKYIYETRNFFFNRDGSGILSILKSFKNPIELRDFLVATKQIKGIGYKEASHFLRNIGFRGYAILDKHILNTMREFLLIKDPPRTMNRKNYLMLETILKEFADEIKIDFDELDLLFWSEKTGEILK